jgi:predicted nucleotidyltransferase component of viral defense system
MLNKEKHQLIMGRILKDIYADVSISSLIGLKGGTCAYFFYGLPRFSVDLDFDLLTIDKEKRSLVFERVGKMLEKYGAIKDSHIKRNTILFWLSYGDADHNIKIEINTRMILSNIKERFKIKEYLGISMLVARKDYLFAGKLAALTLRSEMAARDIYDIWYFAKNNWDIDAEIVKTLTGKTIKEYLTDCVRVIEKIRDNRILQGLGEFLDEKEKIWAKNNLRKETIFLLKNYQFALK